MTTTATATATKVTMRRGTEFVIIETTPITLHIPAFDAGSVTITEVDGMRVEVTGLEITSQGFRAGETRKYDRTVTEGRDMANARWAALKAKGFARVANI